MQCSIETNNKKTEYLSFSFSGGAAYEVGSAPERSSIIRGEDKSD